MTQLVPCVFCKWVWLRLGWMQFVAEATATLGRRSQGKPEDVWLKSPMYPDYYLNTFHYQVHLPIIPFEAAS